MDEECGEFGSLWPVANSWLTHGHAGNWPTWPVHLGMVATQGLRVEASNRYKSLLMAKLLYICTFVFLFLFVYLCLCLFVYLCKQGNRKQVCVSVKR